MAEEGRITRYRNMCKPHKIYTMLNNVERENPERRAAKIEILKSTGFGDVLKICNWPKIPAEFIQFVAKNFEAERSQIRLGNFEALPVKVEDVERVYGLPSEGGEVTTNNCNAQDIRELRQELGLGVIAANVDRVSVQDMEAVIGKIKNRKSWCKAVLIYILGCLLCPDNYEGMSLKYAGMVKHIGKVSTYNWSKHVHQHLLIGTCLKTPKADLHFYLIHYIERMGPNSPFARGICTKPTLKEWDVKRILGAMEAIARSTGYERGITAGYANRPVMTTNPIELVPFNPNECPIEKVPEYIQFMENHIAVYQDVLKILNDRVVPFVAKDSDEDSEQSIEDDEEEHNEAFQEASNDANENVSDDSDDSDAPLVKSKSTRKKQGECSERQTLPTTTATPLTNVEKAHSGARSDLEKAPNEVVTPSKEDVYSAPKIVEEAIAENVATKESGDGSMDFSPPNFKLVSSSTPELKRNLDASFQAEESASAKKRKAYEVEMQYAVEHASEIFDDAQPTGEKICRTPLPPSTTEIIDVDNIAEDKWIELSKQKNLSSTKQYKWKRARVPKLSYLLKSPYDRHVHYSKSKASDKNLVTFVWSPDLPEDEPIYEGKGAGLFNLVRKDLWSLQEGEWVSSAVIDNWANYLNMEHRSKKKRMLALTCESSIHTLLGATREYNKDSRSHTIASDEFKQKLKIFNDHMDGNNLDVSNLEYIVIPAYAEEHFVTYVLNLKKGRYEYLNSDPRYPRKKKSGTFSTFEPLGDRLMNEARSYVMVRYEESGQQCPHKWEEFRWYDAEMPQIVDGASCGVMTMMFMKEWDGSERRMESFNAWPKNDLDDQKIQVNQFRIELCATIVNHKNNKNVVGRDSLQKKANLFCKQLQEHAEAYFATRSEAVRRERMTKKKIHDSVLHGRRKQG